MHKLHELSVFRMMNVVEILGRDRERAIDREKRRFKTPLVNNSTWLHISFSCDPYVQNQLKVLVVIKSVLDHAIDNY